MSIKILEAKLIPLENHGKKYRFNLKYEKDGRIKYYNVLFGSSRHGDYTINKDKERRRLYRLRHSKDRLNQLSPGSLSWHILWGPYTDVQKNFNYFVKNIMPELIENTDL